MNSPITFPVELQLTAKSQALLDALAVIWGIAENNENCINSDAEEVGCNWTDDARIRRMTAHLAHTQKKGEA